MKRPKPLSVQRKLLNQLPPQYADATNEAFHEMSVPSDHPVRLERYRTQDIKRIVENVWKWDCTLTPTMDAHDRTRVQNIINEIQEGAPPWPYVSYLTDDLNGLMEIEHYNPDDPTDFSVINHGDGWHRLVAAVELGLTEVEILFIEVKEYFDYV